MAALQFVANRWLAVDELDGSTYVTLTASGGKPVLAKKYMIQVGKHSVRHRRDVNCLSQSMCGDSF
jgi:hypothetical protein